MKKLNVTMEDVVADMLNVYHQHGKLTKAIYLEHGSYSNTVYERFGSLNKLKGIAGIQDKNNYNVSKEELIEDVLAVYNRNGRVTQVMYMAEGNYSRKPILRLFGSWNNMLQELDLKINCLINIPEEDLLKDLQELQEEYGYVTAAIIKSCGKYSLEVYQRRFGSINKAFEKAGLPTRDPGKAIVAKVVIQTIREILKEIPEEEVTFDWLVNDKTNRKLFLDAYFPAHNLVIEYNGIQHYQPCIEWLGEKDIETFKKRVYRDTLKAKLLEEHGLRLLVIKYDQDIDRTSIIKFLATIL